LTAQYGGYQELEYVADLYDAVYQSRDQRDVQFFVRYSTRAEGPILELGCGTGRVLIPTAAAGCQITGLDLSQYMLKKCLQKLGGQPAEIQRRVALIEGNMTAFRTAESYSLVTIPFRPFHHLITVEDQRNCLACVRRHLQTGGLLVLDLFHCYPPSMYDPKYWMEQEVESNLKLDDNRTVSCATRIAGFHQDRQYNDMEIIYYVNHLSGEKERLVQAFPFRYFFRYEVEHLLELAGFKVIDLFGDYDQSAFYSDSPEMIFVAQKK
jgi:SAM-dependent methyltransferase